MLIWGGFTGVGSNAIQLAVATGYEAVSTASPRIFDCVKSLGASAVFDYNEGDLISDIVMCFDGKEHVGAFAIGNMWAQGSSKPPVERCSKTVTQAPGRESVTAAMRLPEKMPEGITGSFTYMSVMRFMNISYLRHWLQGYVRRLQRL